MSLQQPVIAILFTVLLLSPSVVPQSEAQVPPTDALGESTAAEQIQNMTTYRAKSTVMTNTTQYTDIIRSKNRGELYPSEVVVVGETLVFEIHSSSLSTLMQSAAGQSATEKFFSLRNTSSLTFQIVEPAPGPNVVPGKIEIDQTDTRVIHDRSNETVWVLIDTRSVSLVTDDGDPLDRYLTSPDYRANLTISGDNRSTVSYTTPLRLRPPSASVPRSAGIVSDSRPWVRRPDTDGPINLTVTIPLLPGSSLTVSLVSENGTVVASESVRTTGDHPAVTDGQKSAVNVSLPSVSPPANRSYWLVVEHDGHLISKNRVAIGEPPRLFGVTARLVSHENGTRTAAVTVTVRLPNPGFVVLEGQREFATFVPEDVRVQRTVSLPESALDKSGLITVRLVDDTDLSGTLESEDRWVVGRLFDADRRWERLETKVRVDPWPPTTETATPTVTLDGQQTETENRRSASATDEEMDTPSATETTSPGVGFLGGVAVLLAGCLSVLLSRRDR